MKKIKIQKLIIQDFKGIKRLVITPKNITNIYGANGTCKTTIADAYSWVLFGKNSNDETDFNIKKLDLNNQAVHNREHTVEVVLSVSNDNESESLMAFKRIYKEDWTKPKGQANEIFSGHTTTYWINEVPKSQKEYKEAISLIIPEATFKILSNPLYFNNQLKWDARRPILFALVNEIKDVDIAIGNIQFEALLKELTNIDLNEFKKMLNAKRKNLKGEFDTIPARIDELSKQIPEPVNKEQIEQEISLINEQIKQIDNTLSSESEKQKETNLINAKIQKDLGELNLKLQQEEQQLKIEKLSGVNEVNLQLNVLQNSLNTAKTTIQNTNTAIENCTRNFELKNALLIKLRSDFKVENEKELIWDEASIFTCPACNRLYKSDDIEEKKITLTNNHNAHKSQLLDKINKDGVSAKAELEHLKNQYEELKGVLLYQTTHVTKLENEINELLEKKKVIDINANNNVVCELILTTNLKTQIEQLKAKLNTVVSSENAPQKNNEIELLKQTKINLTNSLSQLNQKLGNVNTINSFNNRIEELKQLQQSLGQQIADIEKKEYVASEFERKKVTTIETLINSKFNFVKFKMFETLVNGNVDNTCECLVNGVAFGDVNTAGKINAGIDIINTLSKHFNISLPLFLDNRESVTEIINFEGQLINLIVSKDDSVLKIENK